MKDDIKAICVLQGHYASHLSLEVTISVEEHSSLQGSCVQKWVSKVTYTFNLPEPVIA